METCTTTHGVPMEPLDINFTHPVFHSPEVLRAASGGDSRECLLCLCSPRDAENWLLDSIIEMQAFLVALIRRFDVSLADHQPQIRRARPGMMLPLVIGEEHKGTQLPLKITAIRDV